MPIYGSIGGCTAYFVGQQLADNNEMLPIVAVSMAVGLGADAHVPRIAKMIHNLVCIIPHRRSPHAAGRADVFAYAVVLTMFSIALIARERISSDTFT